MRKKEKNDDLRMTSQTKVHEQKETSSNFQTARKGPAPEAVVQDRQMSLAGRGMGALAATDASAHQAQSQICTSLHDALLQG